MRWFLCSISLFIEPFLMGQFSWCLHILRMTILPWPVNNPLRERTVSGKSFRHRSTLLPGVFVDPEASQPLIMSPELACWLCLHLVCVCSCSCFISFSSAVISLCLSCMLVFHDTFAMLIRMLLLIMPCHYSTLFACHRYKLLWGL